MILSSALAVANLMAVINNPNTGDTRNPVMFVVIGVIAAVLIALSVILSSVSKKNKK